MPTTKNDSNRAIRLARRQIERMAKGFGNPATLIEYKASAGRSAGKNTIIARTMAKQGRNAWVPTDRQERPIEEAVQTLSGEILDGRDPVRAVQKMLKTIGALLVRAFSDNLFRGGFRPLSEARIKQKGHARPLFDTGALARSMVHKDIVGKGR